MVTLLRRDSWILWLLAALVGATVAVLGMASAGRAGGYGVGQSCYPHNEFVYKPGDADVSASGWMRFDESELEYPNTDETDNGGGKMYFSAAGSVRQTGAYPSMSGTMQALVFWDIGGITAFKSSCVAEVQATREGDVGGLEMEGEGTILGFPGMNGIRGIRSAVMSLTVTPSDTPGALSVHPGFELGTTCFEGDTPSDETEVGFSGDTTLVKLSSPNVDVGRWGFPSGYGPGGSGLSLCPGAF